MFGAQPWCQPQTFASLAFAGTVMPRGVHCLHTQKKAQDHSPMCCSPNIGCPSQRQTCIFPWLGHKLSYQLWSLNSLLLYTRRQLNVTQMNIILLQQLQSSSVFYFRSAKIWLNKGHISIRPIMDEVGGREAAWLLKARGLNRDLNRALNRVGAQGPTKVLFFKACCIALHVSYIILELVL